jgi:hypothetical protein
VQKRVKLREREICRGCLAKVEKKVVNTKNNSFGSLVLLSQRRARTKNTPLDHRLQLFVRLVEIIVDDDGIKESTP